MIVLVPVLLLCIIFHRLTSMPKRNSGFSSMCNITIEYTLRILINNFYCNWKFIFMYLAFRITPFNISWFNVIQKNLFVDALFMLLFICNYNVWCDRLRINTIASYLCLACRPKASPYSCVFMQLRVQHCVKLLKISTVATTSNKIVCYSLLRWTQRNTFFQC